MKINFNNSELKVTAGLPKQFPRSPLPQIAFSGRSNVGKSSLINTLLNRKSLARVSSAPGKTITINYYSVDNKFFLVDLPGYGYAKRTYEDKLRWSKLVDGYFTSNPDFDKLKLVAQLIDSRIGPTNDDLDMLHWMNESGTPYMIVLTKADKLNKTEQNKIMEIIADTPEIAPDVPVILFSAQSKEGREEVLKIMMEYCGL